MVPGAAWAAGRKTTTAVAATAMPVAKLSRFLRVVRFMTVPFRQFLRARRITRTPARPQLCFVRLERVWHSNCSRPVGSCLVNVDRGDATVDARRQARLVGADGDAIAVEAVVRAEVDLGPTEDLDRTD